VGESIVEETEEKEEEEVKRRSFSVRALLSTLAGDARYDNMCKVVSPIPWLGCYREELIVK